MDQYYVQALITGGHIQAYRFFQESHQSKKWNQIKWNLSSSRFGVMDRRIASYASTFNFPSYLTALSWTDEPYLTILNSV